MVVDAATIVLKAMRARLPVTASTRGTDSCMKLQWVRKLLLEWVRTMDRFDESLLDDRAFLRLVRTTAYACLAFREAAALICTGRLTLWIRARQQVFPGDSREGVAVHAVLGAKTAALHEPLLQSSEMLGRTHVSFWTRIGVAVGGAQVFGAVQLAVLRDGAQGRQGARAGGGRVRPGDGVQAAARRVRVAAHLHRLRDVFRPLTLLSGLSLSLSC